MINKMSQELSVDIVKKVLDEIGAIKNVPSILIEYSESSG